MKNQVFKMRKTKVFGLCSVVLAMSFMSSRGIVSADEISAAPAETTLVATPPSDGAEAVAEGASTDVVVSPTTTEARAADDLQAEEPSTDFNVLTTGSIDVESATSDGFVSTTTIETTVTGNLQAGDTIDYETENLRLTELNGHNVSLSDGTVIGSVTGRTIESPADNQVAGAVGLTGSANKTKLVVTFNEKVNDLENITYSLKYRGSSQAVLSDKPYTMTAAVKDSYGNVISTPVTIANTPVVDLKDTYAYLSASASVSNVKPDGTLSSNLVYGLYVAEEEPLVKGGNVTLTLQDAPLIYDVSAINVGDTVSLRTLRLNTGDNVDENGIIVVDKATPEFKVVSVTDKEIVFELMSDVAAKDAKYGYFRIPAILTDETAVNEGRTLIESVGYKSTISTAKGDQMLNQTLNLPIFGGSTLASGVKVARSTVKELHVAKSGEVLQAEKVVLADAKAGTKYATAALEFAGFKLEQVPENAEGVLGTSDVLVTYIYTRQLTTDWLDKAGKVLKPQVTGDVAEPAGSVANHKFVETKTDKDGNVTHVFTRLYTTEWVDKDGKSLKAKVTGETQEKAGEFSKYKFVETKTDKDGNVTHVFTRLYTTEWVDTDGKSLKDKVEGESTEEAGSVLDYTFVETKTDADGNVIHVFKKSPKESTVVPTSPISPSAPQSETPTPVEPKTEAPVASTPAKSSAEALPNTGEGSGLLMAVTGALTSVMGLVGLGKRKDDK